MLSCMKMSLAVLLCSLLALPQVAFATSEGDQTMLSQEEIEAAIQQESSAISDENPVAAITASSTYAASGNAKMVRLGGADRYETAAAEARYAFPDGCSDAIVVGSSAWADALTAASLAGAMDCPILFATNYVPAATSSALQDLGVSNVMLIGGPGTISVKAEQELARIVGQSSLVRLYGANRYETQEAVFEYGQSKGFWTQDLLIVASGTNFPDALSVSSLAFAKKAPVVLLDATAYFPSAQLSSLNQALASGMRYKEVAVLGGAGVSSEKALSYANSLTVTGSAAIRLGGSDRYETSASIARWSVDQGYLGWDKAAFAAASLPYDALAGSVVQGKDESVLLLMNDRATQNVTVSLIGANKDAVSSLKLFGGKGSISGITSLNIAKAAGMTYRDLPGGFRVYVDAGHGQNSGNNGAFDPGAISGSYIEANLTSDLANRVATNLRNKGVDAYVNTSGWYKLRHPQAIANGYDAFISIHFNAGGGSGTESYIHSYNASPFSARWQSLIHPKLVSAVGLRDRGQKREEFAVCGGRLPSVLLEICYIDNWSDMSRYLSRRDAIASAIAEGAVQW